ncbi:MAG: ATP-binding protein [Methanomicrobiales archaeon]
MSEMGQGRRLTTAGTDETVHAVLVSISEVMTQGSPVSPVPELDPGDKEVFRQIIADLTALQQFSRTLASGSISGDLKVKGFMAGYVKAIQANLLHLTWQAKMISEGDLSQRVDFMGDFSDSFNSMVENLQTARVETAARERDLSEANEHLSSEVQERERAERALSQVNRKLNLLASITRHDILNQLTVLLGYLDLIRDELQDPHLRSFLEHAEVAATSIQHQIEFTKEYQSLGVESPTWQLLGPIIGELRAQFNLGAVSIGEQLGYLELFADPLLEKVFYNLVDNALRYGETLTKIEFSAKPVPGGLILSCEDDGTGVPEKDKERIFQRGVGKHTGLGLFLVREILSITGMTISETGVDGQGARFEIFIPEGGFRQKAGQAITPVY